MGCVEALLRAVNGNLLLDLIGKGQLTHGAGQRTGRVRPRPTRSTWGLLYGLRFLSILLREPCCFGRLQVLDTPFEPLDLGAIRDALALVLEHPVGDFAYRHALIEHVEVSLGRLADGIRFASREEEDILVNL